ncbi:MAG: hypothetical protein LBJ03_01810 [Holosporales bacterium]|jgi:hypothetical protein|nr:hypothetical protein [Holosporales bacterium]
MVTFVKTSNEDDLGNNLRSLYNVAYNNLKEKLSLSDSDIDNQVIRTAKAFALYEVSGGLAYSFGVFPKTLNVEESINIAFGLVTEEERGMSTRKKSFNILGIV